ncbi:MAG: DUF2341 domain-containing protein, partial [Candidatus Hadarchaeales archaeon]
MKQWLRQEGLSPIVGAVLVIGIFTGLAITVYSSYSKAASRNEETETLSSLLKSFLQLKEGMEKMENGTTLILPFKLNVGGKTGGTLWVSGPPAWWNYSWTHRMPITIQGYHPADYQIKLVIPRAPEMKTDYGDLRFFEEEWGLPLPYWIENRTPDKVIVWVRRLKANDGRDNLIYVYYGNPDATDASNGEATFLLFEDFNGTALDTSKWTWHNPRNAFGYSVSGGEFRIWTVQKGSYADGYRAGITCANVFPQDIVVEKRYKFLSAYREGTQFSRNDDNMTDLGGRFGSGAIYISTVQASIWYATGTSSQNFENFGILSSNTYYIHQLRVRTGFYIKSSYLDSARNTLLTSSEYQVTYLSWDNLKRFVGVSVWHVSSGDATNNDFYVDWILVRRWTSPEPTVSFGSPQKVEWGEWAGRMGFTSQGLDIGDLSLVVEGGGLFRVSGGSAEMLSPPALLRISEVREENMVRWVRVDVRLCLFENRVFQLAANSPVSLRFVCTSDEYSIYPEGGRPNRERVVLSLENWVSPNTRQAWRKYLEYLVSVFPPYYGLSLDPTKLELTVEGFDDTPGVKDILY